MKYLPEVFAIVFLSMLAVSCATAHTERWPTADEMQDGRIMCRALCSSYKRNYREYRTDGKCVCSGMNEQ